MSYNAKVMIPDLEKGILKIILSLCNNQTIPRNIIQLIIDHLQISQVRYIFHF